MTEIIWVITLGSSPVHCSAMRAEMVWVVLASLKRRKHGVVKNHKIIFSEAAFAHARARERERVRARQGKGSKRRKGEHDLWKKLDSAKESTITHKEFRKQN